MVVRVVQGKHRSGVGVGCKCIKRGPSDSDGWTVRVKEFRVQSFKINKFRQQAVVGGIAKNGAGFNVIRVIGLPNFGSEFGDFCTNVHAEILPAS